MTVKTAISLVGTASPTSETLKRRCSRASRHITRRGLIRELEWNEGQLQKSGKRSVARLGVRAGRRGWRRGADGLLFTFLINLGVCLAAYFTVERK